MATDRPILIAGGGIGGLATAPGLAQKGFSSLVLERAPELGEIGAGIQLGPNAFHAFDYLEVDGAARLFRRHQCFVSDVQVGLLPVGFQSTLSPQQNLTFKVAGPLA